MLGSHKMHKMQCQSKYNFRSWNSNSFIFVFFFFTQDSNPDSSGTFFLALPRQTEATLSGGVIHNCVSVCRHFCMISCRPYISCLPSMVLSHSSEAF